jgi:hypothetical protein
MSTDPTQFTRESARRIASVVRSAELTPLAASPLNFDRVDFSKARLFRTGTFAGPWPIGTENTVTLANVTSTPNTVSAQNLFFPIDFSPSGEPDCGIAKEGTAWFLVSVPLEASVAVTDLSVSETKVFSPGSTTKLTFIGTGSTSTISFATGETSEITYIAAVIKATSEITILTAVSAELGEDCKIKITPTEETITVVTDAYGTEETETFLVDAKIQTAVSVSMSATQTAIVVGAGASQTITVINNYSTTPVLKLGF